MRARPVTLVRWERYVDVVVPFRVTKELVDGRMVETRRTELDVRTLRPTGEML